MTSQQQHIITFNKTKCESMKIQNQNHDQTSNVTQQRRKRKKTHKKTIALNVIRFMITKSKNSINKNITSEIKSQNSRQSNSKHAQTTSIHEDKILKFHTGFMIGIFKNIFSKASKSSNFHTTVKINQHEKPDWSEKKSVMN